MPPKKPRRIVVDANTSGDDAASEKGASDKVDQWVVGIFARAQDGDGKQYYHVRWGADDEGKPFDVGKEEETWEPAEHVQACPEPLSRAEPTSAADPRPSAGAASPTRCPPPLPYHFLTRLAPAPRGVGLHAPLSFPPIDAADADAAPTTLTVAAAAAAAAAVATAPVVAADADAPPRAPYPVPAPPVPMSPLPLPLPPAMTPPQPQPKKPTMPSARRKYCRSRRGA